MGKNEVKSSVASCGGSLVKLIPIDRPKCHNTIRRNRKGFRNIFKYTWNCY